MTLRFALGQEHSSIRLNSIKNACQELSFIFNYSKGEVFPINGIEKIYTTTF